ncbi:MAG: efflux RND transporter periplasmic adaptor subunit [Pseudomonadales bacterium]
MKRFGLLSVLMMASGVTLAAQPVAVEVAHAVVLEEAPRIWVPGTVLSRQDAEIGVEVEGRLIHVVDPGSRVEAGAPLAQLDDRAWRFELREAESRMARLDARLAFLDKEVSRLSRLSAADSVARNQLEELETERAMVQQDHALAVVDRDRAAYRIEQAKISAPYAGQVVERLAELGEYAQRGQSVVRLVNLQDREVRAMAPLRVAPFLAEGQSVPVRWDDETESVQLSISTIIPVGDLGSRSFELRLRLAASHWVIGAPMEVGLPTAAPRLVIAVPRDALVLRNEDTWIYRINGDGVAERLSVDTGIGIGEFVEVKGGVAAGDRVVVRGAETLRHGQPVRDVSG